MSDEEATGSERDWDACGLGICAANAGHVGTCAEASGWDAVDPGPETLSTRAPGDTGNAAAYVAMGRDEEGGE